MLDENHPERDRQRSSAPTVSGRARFIAADASRYYVQADGTVVRVPDKRGDTPYARIDRARLLRRAERRAIVGVRAWREGARAPSTAPVKGAS